MSRAPSRGGTGSRVDPPSVSQVPVQAEPRLPKRRLPRRSGSPSCASSRTCRPSSRPVQPSARSIPSSPRPRRSPPPASCHRRLSGRRSSCMSPLARPPPSLRLLRRSPPVPLGRGRWFELPRRKRAQQLPRAPRAAGTPALAPESRERSHAPELVMAAPVEMWFGDHRVGVKHGTKTYDQFRRYADSLFDDLRAAGSAR